MALTSNKVVPGRFIPDRTLKEPQPHPHYKDVKYISWAYANSKGLDIPGGCNLCVFNADGDGTGEYARDGSPCHLSACDMGVYVSTASLVALRLTR